MYVEDIEPLWEQDSKIDRTELGEEALRGEQLHSKYWKYFARAKMDLRAAERDLKKIRLEKWKWYTQGPTKENLKENLGKGWKLPPAGRILKQDAERYMEADEDMQKAEAEVERRQDAVDLLESILKTVAFRGTSIKNFIEWEKFTVGAGKI